MDVLIPMHIEDCESDCKFWEVLQDGTRMCNFDIEGFFRPILDKFGVPDWCPLKKFVKEQQ